MALAKKYGLPTTWLLQYDALVEGPFVEFLKREMPENHEVGIWFEVVEQNAVAAGIPWRGRWSWDWHTDVGFSVGYTPRERELLADAFIAKFEETFGRRPASMGSWLFDAHLLRYLHERYGIEAACNCKDQYGTDGYTLWGGYWANGYYPAVKNAYLPAQREEAQIPVPVFRMLGSDPLYQYSAGIAGNGQHVITLEPMYVLTYYEKSIEVRRQVHYYKYVDDMNQRHALPLPLLIMPKPFKSTEPSTLIALPEKLSLP